MSKKLTETELNAAKSLLAQGNSYRQVHEHFPHISLQSLHNNVKGAHSNTRAGRSYALSEEVESEIVKILNVLADWHLPMTIPEFQIFIQLYLKKLIKLNTIETTSFNNDMPSEKWVKSFIQRNKLTLRLADKVKRSRSCINEEEINKFFDHLAVELKDIPPQNIINYDETNLRDDTGNEKVLVSRNYGNRVQRTKQHSKQCISVMFSGNALGEFQPPMVVFKSLNLYGEWTVDGPVGAVYGHTKSGWFDGDMFKKWFEVIIMPLRSRLVGPIVVIGDNLAAHFTPNVLELCRNNNIRFITLVPNSTHLTQPLDVAVFRPLKVAWKKVLSEWRLSGHPTGGIPKETFPNLLRQLMPFIKRENLISGFRACGIYPLSRNEVLKRIPKQVTLDKDVLNEATCDVLKLHMGLVEGKGKKKKRPTNKVEPGKAVQELASTPPTPLSVPKNDEVVPSKKSANSKSAQMAAKKKDEVVTSKKTTAPIPSLTVSSSITTRSNKRKAPTEAASTANIPGCSKVAQLDNTFTDTIGARRSKRRKQSKISVAPESDEDDEGDEAGKEWFCPECGEKYDTEKGSVWIRCGMCKEWYHLECSGIKYDGRKYYTTSFEHVKFFCRICT